MSSTKRMTEKTKDKDLETAEAASPGAEAAESAKSDEPSRQDEPAPAAQAEVDRLAAIIEEKGKEIAELKDKYLRSLADSENARKRIRQQSEESVRIQREALLRELLPVVDDLERAVDAAGGGGNGKSIVEGVEMVLRSMHDFLRSQGVSQVSAIGQSFDPMRHEAVDQIESSTEEPNTIVREFNPSYLIGERVLRPARVTVVKAAEPQKDEEEAKD
jgi:molecular chaperone GrpE